MVVLSSNVEMKARGLKPLARIVGFAEIGVDPMSMGLGPIGAVTKLVSMQMIAFYFTMLKQFFPSLNYMLVIPNILLVEHLVQYKQNLTQRTFSVELRSVNFYYT